MPSRSRTPPPVQRRSPVKLNEPLDHRYRSPPPKSKKKKARKIRRSSPSQTVSHRPDEARGRTRRSTSPSISSRSRSRSESPERPKPKHRLPPATSVLEIEIASKKKLPPGAVLLPPRPRETVNRNGHLVIKGVHPVRETLIFISLD